MIRWSITFTARAAKQYAKLGHAVQEQITDLLRDISIGGPTRPDWPNYSKLGKEAYHCHVKKAVQPTWYAGA